MITSVISVSSVANITGNMTNKLLWIGSSLFILGMVVSTLIAVPITFFLLTVPFPLRFRLVANWARFNLWWLRVTCGIKAEIEGMENIIDQPAIIMCKHQSTWETLVIQLLFPPQVWLLKRELLRIPIYGWGLATMKPIAIDRSLGVRSLRQLVREGKERLSAGLWVVVFPEGTRLAPGVRRKYHPGGAMLAEKSGYPIIPIAHNAGYLWPRNSFLKRPGTIRMVIGPPIPSKGKKAAQILRETEDWIETTIAGLPLPAGFRPTP